MKNLKNKSIIYILLILVFAMNVSPFKVNAQCGFTFNYSYSYGPCDTVEHSVILFVNGGSSPFSYSWDNLFTTPQNFLDTGYHWVCVTDNAGCTQCDTFSLNCDTWWGGTAINEVSDSEFEILPNPFVDEIKISLKKYSSTIVKVSIYDYYGQLMSKSHYLTDNNQIDLSHLTSGFYYCIIELNKKLFTRKIFKI